MLGPILFIIYVNDLPDCIQSYLGIFADDTKLYRPICSSEDSSILQEDIDSALQWCDTWLSFLNVTTAQLDILHQTQSIISHPKMKQI